MINKSAFGVGLSYKALSKHRDPLVMAQQLLAHRHDRPIGASSSKLSSPRVPIATLAPQRHPAVIMPKGYRSRITLAKVGR